jgi:hypothetical protein
VGIRIRTLLFFHRLRVADELLAGLVIVGQLSSRRALLGWKGLPAEGSTATCCVTSAASPSLERLACAPASSSVATTESTVTTVTAS